jgi:hypothetical protein
MFDTQEGSRPEDRWARPRQGPGPWIRSGCGELTGRHRSRLDRARTSIGRVLRVTYLTYCNAAVIGARSQSPPSTSQHRHHSAQTDPLLLESHWSDGRPAQQSSPIRATSDNPRGLPESFAEPKNQLLGRSGCVLARISSEGGGGLEPSIAE